MSPPVVGSVRGNLGLMTGLINDGTRKMNDSLHCYCMKTYSLWKVTSMECSACLMLAHRYDFCGAGREGERQGGLQVEGRR